MRMVSPGDTAIRFPTKVVRSGLLSRRKRATKKPVPFDGKLELPLLEQATDHLLAAGLFPKPLEDHGRSDRTSTHLDRFTASMRGQQQDRFAELGSRAEQAFQLARLLKLIESSQRGDNALLGASVFPAVLDDLQVDAFSGVRRQLPVSFVGKR